MNGHVAAHRKMDIAGPVSRESQRPAIVPPKFASSPHQLEIRIPSISLKHSPMVTEAEYTDKILRTKKPPRFCTRAVPTKNRIKDPYETKYIGLLPKYSDSGAKVIGPNASPRTYKLNPSVLTSALTPNIASIFFMAGLYPLAPHNTQRSIKVIDSTMDHFRHVGQFREFDGSFGEKVGSLESSEEEG